MYNICAVAETLLWSKNFPCCCFSLEVILSFKGRSSGPPKTFEALIQNDPLAVIASQVAEWDIIFGKQTGIRTVLEGIHAHGMRLSVRCLEFLAPSMS